MPNSNESESQQDSSQRPERQIRCFKCGELKPKSAFRRRSPTCQACISAVPKPRDSGTLHQKVAEHRQRKLLMKAERKLALQVAIARRNEKKRAKKAAAAKAAQAEIMIQLPPEDQLPVVDPIVKEMARRELVRRRLIEFVKDFHPRYKAGWVHNDICNRLERFAKAVEAGESPRLMILMPPRHGKSQIASKLYPAWHLGHYPHHEFISCSYNVSLALNFSREVRATLREERYQQLFPKTKLDPDFQAAEEWKLTDVGGYVAAGIGGGITGKGAHVLVIDDPIKNDKEADSIDVREGIWNWYQATAYTRLAPGGGILVIQTCWHDDDLAGRLEKEMRASPEADQWEIVRYSAIAEEDEKYRLEGDPLHEERYDLASLMRIKRTLSNRYWTALYQQKPVPDEGAFFTKEMIRTYLDRPPLDAMNLYMAWDFAITEKQQSDYTVGVLLGQDYDDNLYVLDMIRFRSGDAHFIVTKMLDMYAVHKSLHPLLGAEDGQIWKAMQSEWNRECKARKLYPSWEPLKPFTDKQVRARPLQGRMQAGKVLFPQGASWYNEMMGELLRFPTGEHDDIVDALAWAVRVALLREPPRRPETRRKKGELTVAEKIARLARGASVRGATTMAA